MIGKIFIINKTTNTGKVLFENGKESCIIDFPINFENNDKIEINFRNNNIEDKPLNMIAYSENNYGFVMKKFNATNGNILVTYPNMIGLVNFSNSNFSDKDNPKIVFNIKKTIDGREDAINIKYADKSDFYKCKIPIFGRIKRTITEVKESYISNLILKTQMENVVNGKIKVIKEDRGFGFIECFDGSVDVFFNYKTYIKFYNQKPKKGDIVNFIAHSSQKGSSVITFCNQEQYLPKEQQYGIIDNRNFLINDYEKILNKKPEIGDIVYYTLENEVINFKQTAQALETFEFEQFSSKNSKYKQGKITKVIDNNVRAAYGFINSSNKTVFFMVDTFRNMYKHEPKKNDLVFFEEIETSKGFSVKYFIKPHNKVLALPSSYKNFVYPDENDLYFAYIDNNETKEIHKYNPKVLSESISCYKDKNIPKLFKIQAINSLIENNFHNKNIAIDILKNERLSLINTTIEQNIESNNGFVASEYEHLLQNISYKPTRLSRLSKVLELEYKIDSNKNSVFKEIINNDKINYDLEIGNIEFEEENYKQYLAVDISKYKIEPTKFIEAKWAIDIKNTKLNK